MDIREVGGSGKVAWERSKEEAIPLTKGTRLLRGKPKSRGQTWKEKWMCLIFGVGWSLHRNREGKGWDLGLEWEGRVPRPGVLTQENCRKVTRSVEDAEIKTNVLKQNSALLEVREWSQDLVRGSNG